MIDEGIIKQGTLVSVEQGAYSDHRVIGMFVAIEDFSPKARVEAFVQIDRGDDDDYVGPDELLAHLLRAGLLLEVRYDALHLGDYGLHLEEMTWGRYVEEASSAI